ncbi:protein-glutamate O-methyltransferase CheR [Teredinibacter sp. KSP-S5-2]|uniref:CheR family methyltransferase n=1 Tax=Teredinibacter sp. KSP-S5-2 TaxID=3034506 RepID=UPI002934FCFA|nr:protein-glutamate O-methyltransferase CheR [Teredinibacter sp. KSP-S5-2]WNO07984.1 protein-glutamate O-methyltransferase CheR [Teredinibacter sp. KSP-S5-2]
MIRHKAESVTLGSGEFQEFRDYLQEIAGIDLADNKQYLVATRIRRILSENNCNSLVDLTRLIKQPSQRDLRQKVINAMTTNETFWFRDSYPYEHLRHKLLPEFAKVNAMGKMRIWSAACSSGQEPYSLSMVVDEYRRSALGGARISAEIVATDLSSNVLDQAKQGIYDRLSIGRGLSEQRLKTFFTPHGNETWEVKPEIKRCVTFRQLNLQDSYGLLGKFDIIFCRNVLIYFSGELKKNILTRMHAALKPKGVLYLGASESLAGAADLFEVVNCNPGVLYRAK